MLRVTKTHKQDKKERQTIPYNKHAGHSATGRYKSNAPFANEIS